MPMKPITVPKTAENYKLEKYLFAKFPSLSRADFFKAVRGGEIRINSKRVKGAERLTEGDEIRIPPYFEKFKNPVKIVKSNDGSDFNMSDLEQVRQTIIYNDADMVAFNKPAGLAVQGGTLVKKSLDKMAAALFPNDTVLPVHRLDKETSGIIVFAKNIAAAQNLSEQLSSKSAKKEYLAILSGDVKAKSGIIDSVIQKDNRGMASDAQPKRAITEFEVLGNIPQKMTYIHFIPKTGRTHQLRIHSAKELKAPIFGDEIYGHKKDAEKFAGKMSKHLYLLAWKLTIRQPNTGVDINLIAKAPDFMQNVIDKFNK
jgi:23S rRNA pseudouridine955/2504/2580 synthase